MWFRRKKKSDQDSVLNEALRSLQGIIEESDTDEMLETDGRREPSLHPELPAAQPTAEDKAAPRATPEESEGGQSSEATWHNLSLSFDVEPRPGPEPDTEPGQAPESTIEQHAPAEAAVEPESTDEDEAQGTRKARTRTDTAAEGPVEDDDIEIVIDSPAPGYARDEGSEDESGAVKFGSSVVEITLDMDDLYDDAEQAGVPAASATPEPAAAPAFFEESQAPVDTEEPTVAEPRPEPLPATGISEPATDVVSEDAGDAVEDREITSVEEPEPAIDAAAPAASSSAVPGEPATKASHESGTASTEEATAASMPTGDRPVTEPAPAMEITDVAHAADPVEPTAELDGQQPADKGDEGPATAEQTVAAVTTVDSVEAQAGAERDDSPDRVEKAGAMTADSEPAVEQVTAGDGAAGTQTAAGDTRAATPIEDIAATAAGQDADETDDAPLPEQEPDEESHDIDSAEAPSPPREPGFAAAAAPSRAPTEEEVATAAPGSDATGPLDVSSHREPQDETSDAVAAVVEAIRDAEALRIRAGDAADAAVTEAAGDHGAVPSDDTPAAAAPPSAQGDPPAEELVDDIPVLDDLVYVPEEHAGTVGKFPVDSPPLQARAAVVPTVETPAGPQSDADLQPLVRRITQNLRLRLELGEGTPLDEEQESQLRDALFDTLAQWKARGDL